MPVTEYTGSHPPRQPHVLYACFLFFSSLSRTSFVTPASAPLNLKLMSASLKPSSSSRMKQFYVPHGFPSDCWVNLRLLSDDSACVSSVVWS